MPDLTIKNINQTWVQIQCDKGIALELADKFTFEVPGARFTPAYKNHRWDGKIRLFDRRWNKIYRGLVTEIKAFCKDNNYEYDYEDDDSFNVTLDEIQTFTQKLNPKHDPREYQLDAVISAINRQRILLLSPTASGKSLIIYLLINFLLAKKYKKGLIIVPTINLVEQMAGDFIEYSENNGLPFGSLIHKIYQGQDKDSKKPITISTWQSLYTMPPEFFEQFDFVIGDEAHLFTAKSIQYIMSNLINAEFRIGTTGTLDGTKTHQMVLEGLFGPVHRVISTHELIKQKFAAEFAINGLVLEYPDHIKKALKGASYQEEIEFLVLNETRNKYIANLAVAMTKNTLVLFQYVKKHGMILEEMIRKKLEGTGRNVYFVYGKTDVEIREEIRKLVETESNCIIIASVGTFSTGINIQNLHNIIFTAPSKSRIRVLQSIGRALRLNQNKDVAVLYDIADDLHYKTHENHTLRHFRARLNLYSEEKFPFKTYRIQLKET